MRASREQDAKPNAAMAAMAKSLKPAAFFIIEILGTVVVVETGGQHVLAKRRKHFAPWRLILQFT
jgi:hypothetical protein